MSTAILFWLMVTRLIYSNYILSQKQAVRAITFFKSNATSAPNFNKLKLLTVNEINVLQTCCFVFNSWFTFFQV